MSKQISLGELEQLKRFMGVTFSVHDPEALTGLRKANQILKRHGLTWAEVLGRAVSAGAANGSLVQPAGTEVSIADQIRKAFDELRGTIRSGSFGEFVASLEDQFETTGYLTPEQRRPLFEAVRKQREGRRRD